MKVGQAAIDPKELVIDRATGQVRQAGADQSMGKYIQDFRRAAEQSLFVFAKGVLGLSRLTTSLHKPVCEFLMKTPPYRKMILLPRDHLKSSICSRALPIHILIQPKESNCYIPGKDGADTRILLSTKTATNAQHQLRWIEARLETCDILQALWPHRVWENARKQSRKWSEAEMMIPRKEDFPEASIETIGVGGKVVGRHYDVMIKDDLIDIEDANSEVVMNTAIEWHKASRALMDDPDKSLEFILGTRWAVYDLYQDIIDLDPTVEVVVRAAIEDGRTIFPEMFSMDTLNRLHREMGPRFFLLYMNSAHNPELTDFDMDAIRLFEFQGPLIRFSQDERDGILAEAMARADKGIRVVPEPIPGVTRLNRESYDMMKARNEYIRGRAT